MSAVVKTRASFSKLIDLAQTVAILCFQMVDSQPSLQSKKNVLEVGSSLTIFDFGNFINIRAPEKLVK